MGAAALRNRRRLRARKPLLSWRFEGALAYAARLHAAQRRKGTAIPYVSHLLAVTAIVLENGGDEDEAIAALLHDAVEDQGGKSRLVEIRNWFGPRVARIVEACTDADTLPKPPWRRRKEIYIKHLREAPRDVLLVSAADKLHNARAILADVRRDGNRVWERFNGGKEGTLWYYRTLFEVFRELGPRPMAVELGRVVEQLGRLAEKRRAPRRAAADRPPRRRRRAISERRGAIRQT